VPQRQHDPNDLPPQPVGYSPRVTGSSAQRRVRLIAGFVLVSIVAHVLCLRVLPGAPLSRLAERSEMITLAIESHLRSPPATPNAAELEPSLARPTSAATASNASSRVRPEARATPSPEHDDVPAPPRMDPTDEEATATSPATQPATATAAQAPPVPAAPTPARALELDPRGVALSTLPAPVAKSMGPETPEARGARRSAELSAELHAVANAAPFREHRTPQLARDPDGTCHYAGLAIDATILPDGGVRFGDRPPEVKTTPLKLYAREALEPRSGVPTPPERPTTPEDQLAPQRIEFRARVMGRASAAEREWFLRETVGVRRELADAAHARELQLDEHALRKQLDHIWCDPKRPAAERRRAIFELWDETSSDEIGQRGRKVLLDYVRRNIPRESPMAFPAEQLAVLNAQRRQREAFDPYAARDPNVAR
jgi:hypothetical protein